MTIVWSPNGAINDLIDEQHGSPTEGLSKDGVTATAIIRVPWEHRWIILSDLIPGGREYPYLLNAGLEALTAGIKPVGKSAAFTQGLVYDTAEITLNYGIPDGDDDESGGSSTYAESLEPSAEFTTLDHKKFEWGTGSDRVDIEEAEAPGKLEVGFEYVQKRMGLTTVPSAVLTEIGHCNQNTKVAGILGVSFPAETILYSVPSLSREIAIDGSGVWDLTMSFSYKKNGWNTFWRADTQEYEKIRLKEGNAEYNSYPLSTNLPLI